MSAFALEYVLARRALLDTLDLLDVHQASLILVGAQAVYLHASGGLDVLAHTTETGRVVDQEPVPLGQDRVVRGMPRHGQSRRDTGHAEVVNDECA